MVGETDPPTAPQEVAFSCPRCGAPLPIPADDGFVTCDYCGVRTEVSSLVPPQRLAAPPEETLPPQEPPPLSTGDGFRSGSPLYIVRIVMVVVVIVIVIAVFAASQPQSNSGSPSVAHCSVAINATATSGPAPFAATFTAEVAAPPGDTTSEPMWQFGPFPPGFDLNFTYGYSVTHTWNTSGSYGVHVSVPDSSLQGCYATMSVNVT
jgi:lysine biosynthesis protein LysW